MYHTYSARETVHENSLNQDKRTWGSLTMDFDEEQIKFNIFEDMKNPGEVHSVCSVVVI